MKIIYAPSFVREYKHLKKNLQDEVKQKIAIFEEDSLHPFLKAHKLKGKLKGRMSFSINYQYRIVYRYTKDGDAEFISIGDHSIYQ